MCIRDRNNTSPKQDTPMNNNTSPKLKTLCQCNSTIVMNTVLAKVEHHMTQIFTKLINKFQQQLKREKKIITKNNTKKSNYLII